MTLELDEKQKEALNTCMKNNISFIMGMAGVGKSFTIFRISEALKKEGWRISLIAPTGRAAKRINGTTIHKWLQPIVQEDKYGEPQIIGYEKSQFDLKECLIVDESSMIDDLLWNKIMEIYNNSPEGMTPLKKLIFVGDVGQLEPVGEGTPFLNHANNKTYPSTILDKVHRTEDGNDILDFAIAIRNDENIKPLYTNVNPVSALDALQLATEDINNTQLICPMKDGKHGINSFNNIIQSKLLNDGKLGEKLFDTLVFNREAWKWLPFQEIHQSDKIVFNKNNWSEDINKTNGSVGIVLKREFVPKKVFTFGYSTTQLVDSILFVEPGETEEEGTWVPVKWLAKNCQLAYAISIHKAQGSEWEKVIVSWKDEQTRYGNTKMLYTASTRAKKMLYIIN